MNKLLLTAASDRGAVFRVVATPGIGTAARVFDLDQARRFEPRAGGGTAEGPGPDCGRPAPQRRDALRPCGEVTHGSIAP
jgi:hypothetical protein